MLINNYIHLREKVLPVNWESLLQKTGFDLNPERSQRNQEAKMRRDSIPQMGKSQ